MSLYQHLKAEQENELYHHGIKGQKHGVRKVPWYPIAEYLKARKNGTTKKEMPKDDKSGKNNKSYKTQKVDNAINSALSGKEYGTYYGGKTYKRSDWELGRELASTEIGKQIFDEAANNKQYYDATKVANLTSEGTAETMFRKLPKQEQANIKADLWNNSISKGLDKVEADPDDVWLMWEDWDQGYLDEPDSYSVARWLNQSGFNTRKLASDRLSSGRTMREYSESFVEKNYPDSEYKSIIKEMLEDYGQYRSNRMGVEDLELDQYLKELKKNGY